MSEEKPFARALMVLEEVVSDDDGPAVRFVFRGFGDKDDAMAFRRFVHKRLSEVFPVVMEEDPGRLDEALSTLQHGLQESFLDLLRSMANKKPKH